MLKIASWNVNSIKVRLPQVQEWIQKNQIDILALQETKVVDEEFPKDTFVDMGYDVIFDGQKTYNGVAIISQKSITNVLRGIPNFFDPQRRVIAATIQDIRVINVYVPNGAAVDSDKFIYKLDWLNQLTDYIQQELVQYQNLMVMGDFNIAPNDQDVHAPSEWEGNVLVSPEERKAFQQLLDLGLFDSFRELNGLDNGYSWWDYRMQSFRRNRGLRIDHILMSQALMKRTREGGIDKNPRAEERPSDHAPVWVTIND